ncbi:MAG: DUF1553 domain-containing protein, partial [Planctomycetota bacterium]|nr:DUF1553 domain-containing protein [Planctomycetota bacterium]
LNDDLPYDRFVIEHLAGDLVESPRRDPVTGENESIKATGFFWLGQGKHSPVDIRAEECDVVDNQIDVISKTFLGLTVACARCHDHKFDPIGAADYYALAGYLQSSRQQWVDVSDQEQKEQIAEEIMTIKQSMATKIVDQWHATTDDGRIAQVLLDVVPLLQIDLNEHSPFPEPRLEGESLKIHAVTGGEARTQQMESLGKGKWSDDKHLWWTDGVVGSMLTVNIPVETDGDYRIYAAFTKAHDYGIIKILLDGLPIGEPIDLYDPKVITTGPISLGDHQWKAGDHRLTFEITGSNEKAVPSFMVGLDYVALVSATDEANAEERRNRLALADPQLVELAQTIKARSVSDDAGLLHVWDVLGQENSDDAFIKRKTELRHQLITLRDRVRSQIEPQPEWTTFDSDAAFEQWRGTGMAFWAGPLKSGNLLISDNGTGLSVDVVTKSCLHSGMISNSYEGFVRSPTFSIERKYIDYRVRRTGGLPNPGRANKNGNISLIVDGFQIIRNPLWGNLTFVVPNDGQWHWHRQDVGKHIGASAYIEIGDEDDGYIEVSDIRFTDGEQAPTPPNELLIELLADDAITTPQQLAAAYEYVIQVSFDAFITDRIGGEPIDADRAEFLRLLADISPAPISADAQAQLARFEQRISPPLWALATTDGDSENEHVLIRGNHTKPGELVERRFLEVFDYTDAPHDRTAILDVDAMTPRTDSGRLELIETMIDDAGPLVARVIVNRLWQHHFGEGIVSSPDNFGALGSPPSHPELLDALARELIAHDWSLKHIHRMIVSSATYRMTSQSTDLTAEERDPNNRLLHRMNVKRLEGEPLRDAMLALSGRLNSQMYGPSVMPYLTPFMEGRGRPGQSGPLDGDGRRSIYIGVRRNFLSPMFLAFDLPTPLSTMGKRSTSNVPAQALTLMNNPFVWEQSQHWSQRLEEAKPLDADRRIDRMYLEAFARPPTNEERQIALSFLESSDGSDLAHLLMNLKEFVFIP